MGTIPASAVVTDDHGNTCYFADVTGPGTTIDVAQKEFGMVDVPPGQAGKPVLVNPRQVREELTCA